MIPFIPRDLCSEIRAMMAAYPIVTLIGPRQSGKSTLVRKLYPQLPYVSLEDPDERLLAQADPRYFLSRFPTGGILDEIQRQPELLSYLQRIVDEQNKPGLFILTGSHQLALHQAITQSLAGRTAILKLLPFSMQELAKADLHFSLDELLLRGMYPRLYQQTLAPSKFYSNYTQTYLERDVRQLIQVKDINLFQQFLHLCAGAIGQTINHHHFSHALGVSAHTIKNWLSVLEASFIIFQLQPYFENFGKRITKSGKLYFYDTGLACYLADLKNIEQLQRDPLRGHLFENFVILELLKNQMNQGETPSFYFYRDSQQHEVDLIFKSGHHLIPIEIKSAQTFTSSFMKGLYYFKKLVEERCPKGYLIYTGQQEQRIEEFEVLNYKHLDQIFSIQD